MTIELIADHAGDALARLIEQYKEKPKLAGFLNALHAEIQALENCFIDLKDKRAVSTAEGSQLDEIGAIVGLVRPSGLLDASYRALIYAKIGLNISQGETERIISVFALATGASLVHLQEYYPAGIGIFSDNAIASELENLLWDFVQAVVGAAVRVDHFGSWDGDLAFAFEGSVGTSLGFGDETDAEIGGKLGRYYEPERPIFSFAGDDYEPTESGFGDLNDPVAGGKLS